MSFTTSSGTPIAVGPLLATGGEGEVFAVSAPGYVVFKKYLPVAFSRDPALEQRLRVMVANRPAGWREPFSGHVTLAWPTEVVMENGHFAGFLMPAVNMNSTVEEHRLTNPSDRKHATGPTSWAQKFTWKYLVFAAANLARATEGLHDVRVVIGDFNERNVRVSHDASVTLLDCDSMQVTDPDTGKPLFCRVGRPEFTPPELINADWSKTVRHPSSDLFALAIHIYQLLLEGEHPFRGVWTGPGDKPSVSELAKRGEWAYKVGSQLWPRPSAISIKLLPDAIIKMFRKAFEDGAANPDARPSAADWGKVLGNLGNSLQECTAHPEHFYPSTLSACPWCSRMKRTATQQHPLPPLTAPSNTGAATPGAPNFYGSSYATAQSPPPRRAMPSSRHGVGSRGVKGKPSSITSKIAPTKSAPYGPRQSASAAQSTAGYYLRHRYPQVIAMVAVASVLIVGTIVWMLSSHTIGPASIATSIPPNLSRPIDDKPTAAAFPPRNVKLLCDTMIGGTDCSRTVHLPDDLVSIYVNGLTQPVVNRLCQLGYSDRWSDNYGQTPDFFSEFLCVSEDSPAIGAPDFGSPGGNMRGDFYFPSNPGLWIITWKLLNASGRVVATAKYTVRVLS